jgi:hypothetical protein
MNLNPDRQQKSRTEFKNLALCGMSLVRGKSRHQDVDELGEAEPTALLGRHCASALARGAWVKLAGDRGNGGLPCPGRTMGLGILPADPKKWNVSRPVLHIVVRMIEAMEGWTQWQRYPRRPSGET